MCEFVLQGHATSSSKKGPPAQAQAAREERQPVVHSEGVHWQGPVPNLPACLLQRAPVGSAEDRGRLGVC